MNKMTLDEALRFNRKTLNLNICKKHFEAGTLENLECKYKAALDTLLNIEFVDEAKDAWAALKMIERVKALGLAA